MATADDYAFMARALRLAERGLYTTTPNPRVGCVIVAPRGDRARGEVVGEGFHARAGEDHAEIHALIAAGERARGATVYVTLEPCNHHGRTPPCTNALIAAGVARVVAAMQDPNPLVSGQGLAQLREARIDTECGVLEAQARELNAGFISRMTRSRPWLRLKTAASLDGRTALRNGVSQWITGEAARRDGHRWRARSCAVMVGIGTLLSDNPRLTVRDVRTDRQPLRIVIDRSLAMPLDAKVLDGGQTLVAYSESSAEKMRQLEARGATLVRIADDNGKVDLVELLRELGRRELNEILVESGNRLNGALLRAGLVDELIMYFAPHLLGDEARGMFDLGELTQLDQRLQLSIHDVRRVGADWRMIARVA